MMSNLEEDETLEQLIADISDGYWLIPLHPKERRFFVASFQGKFLVFERTAQGSRGAPLTFCTIMGLATRLLQSLLLRDHLHMKRHKQDARVQVYTDDPWIIAKGTPTQVNRIFSIVLLTWCLFGFPVATHRIGMYISLFPGRVEVSIPPDKVDELERMTLDFLKSNVVSVKALRTYVGKAMSIASVIFTWRPFLNQIFAAIHSDGDSTASNGCIWLRQIEHSLLWFKAFFTSLKHHLVRTWPLDGFLNAGPHVVIIWDASPFGIGAVLCINGAIVEYLHDTPSSFESDLLRLVRGDSESQQVMECLAGLVALRTWAHFCKKRKISAPVVSGLQA